MSNITLDTIRSLDANKTYYLANSTGQIKEAGAWQKFKCFLGLGDARDKVQKLVDGVKVALLKASGESDNAALTAAIEEYEGNHNWLFSASGGSLAGIASRFAVANADKIASASAKAIAGKSITALVKNSVRACLRREDWPADAVRYLERAAKPLVDHPPMRDAGGGRRVLDEAAFETQLKALLDGASNDLVHVATSARLGMTCFDKIYLDHVFATFYDENGVRNERTADDLRPAVDVRREKWIEAAGERPNTSDERQYSALVHVALMACGKDADALDRVFKYLRRILIGDGGQARSPVAVRGYVEGIKKNFEELREAAPASKAALRAALAGLGALPSKPMPAGIIAKIAELARTIDLGPVVDKLGPGSGSRDIHAAVYQYYRAIDRITHEVGADMIWDGQDDLAQGRQLIGAFLLERFPPEILRNIDAALETPLAAGLQQTYFDLSMDADGVPEAGDLPLDLLQMTSKVAGTASTFINSFKATVDAMLALPRSPIQANKANQVDAEDIDARRIFHEFRKDAEDYARESRRNYLAKMAVHGNGPAAAPVRELLSTHLEEFPAGPRAIMRTRFTSVVRPLHSLAALSDAKKVAKGQLKDTGFAQAIADGRLEVEFEDGGKLSSDPDEALDQLARLVAGREDAAFAALDPTVRRKVALIAGLLGDKAMKAISDGVGLALDPAGGKPALAIAGGGEKRRVKIECPRGTYLRMNIETERTGVNVRTGSSSYLLGPGSVVKTHYGFLIGIGRMKKFEEGLDLDTFDGTKAEEVASNPRNVPDRAERVKEIIGADYVLGENVDAVDVEFTLN